VRVYAGNARVPVVCVDINPAVVTKLADRGSSQTVGLVTDVGSFLHQLAAPLAQDDGVAGRNPPAASDA